MAQPVNRFAVVRRVLSSRGFNVVADVAETMDYALTWEQANELADKLQSLNPNEEYAVTETTYRRFTRS